MNNYTTNIEKRDSCTEKALAFLHKGDVYMFHFWAAAARAFEARALDVSESDRETRLFNQIRGAYEMEPRWTA